MSVFRRSLPPSSSLRPLRSLNTLTREETLSALNELYHTYCTLPLPSAFLGSSKFKDLSFVVDSGYASGDEESDNDENFAARDIEEMLSPPHEDAFERAFAQRWLMGFLGRVEELTCYDEVEDARQSIIDKASCILESLIVRAASEDGQDGDVAIIRNFSFTLSMPRLSSDDVIEDSDRKASIDIQLNDGLAGRASDDYLDVGLRSWGAAVVFSDLVCADPSRFKLTRDAFGTTKPLRIVELGAGTGLVSLVLAKVLPRLGIENPIVVATDYHPTVLQNLRTNIASNQTSRTVKACQLDWSNPVLASPLDVPADMLVATDVVYEPEHAIWLRGCASRLLAPDGLFWLVATMRQSGRFEALGESVAAAFTAHDRPRDQIGRSLTILNEETLGKQTGVGRGDESEYKLFRIAWV